MIGCCRHCKTGMALWLLAWLLAILLAFVVRCYRWYKAVLRLFFGPWLKLLGFLSRQCKEDALFRRILAAGIPGRFKEFLKLGPDPVMLAFQGTGGGVLVVRNTKLDMLPSTDMYWKMQAISSDHCRSVPDDKGTCLTFSSQKYYLIGYPETKSVGVTLDGKSDPRTRWRRRRYEDVLPKENKKELESSWMLQLWDDKYSFPPESQLSLYFIINVRSDGFSYELGSPHDAKTNGRWSF